jgi:predicted kinase
MLIVLSGLPGTGKTTIAKALVARLAATYVRVDEIEYAIARHAGSGSNIGPMGYYIAYAVAASNLKLGNAVVADSVNPVPESRQGWRRVAQAIDNKPLLEIEVICSDQVEHRRRVEARTADIDGFVLPTWSWVMSLDYVPWTERRLTLDTALLGVADAVAIIEGRIVALSGDRQTKCS